MSHLYQGNIDFNTVNVYWTVGLFILIYLGLSLTHTDASERYCRQPKCSNNDVTAVVKTFEVENEFHFLVKCKQYDQLRIVLFSRLSCPEFDQLNDQNKFCFMLTRPHVARLVGQFIIDAFDLRPVKTWFKANLYIFSVVLSLVPFGIPSIDFYFLFTFIFFWSWVVSAGTLRWWPLKILFKPELQNNPSPTSAI